MTKFLIEVPHAEETRACARVVQIFLATGSHFLTHADWGCEDEVHSAFITVEAENKLEALRVLPPQFRSEAKATALTKFTMEQIDAILSDHQH
jgi:dihydroorotase-like cyclic amidohydrolase